MYIFTIGKKQTYLEKYRVGLRNFASLILVKIMPPHNQSIKVAFKKMYAESILINFIFDILSFLKLYSVLFNSRVNSIKKKIQFLKFKN